MTISIKSTKDLEKARADVLAARDPDKTALVLCAGTGCTASGSPEVALAFLDELDKAGLKDTIDFRTTGCHGFCEQGPILVIRPMGVFYPQVKPEDVAEIVEKTVKNGEIIERLLYRDPITGEAKRSEADLAFYAGQQRIVLSDNGFVNPRSLEDYLAVGGYAALAKVLGGMKPADVIEEIKKSGLRGRGGAGFPTGIKWEICNTVTSDKKYVICNADEGDPGAFMDRSILEGNPGRVVEGMTIGAFAIGADEAYVYVRHEYPLAVDNLAVMLENLREAGLLGKDILGSGFDFDVKIARGAGAFVCGEETALLQSIEGSRGLPRPRPPYPVEKGLFGKPTVINNVETWANVPVIVNNGADWFAGIGTEGSKGTKVFSLVGNVNNTGLVEVPMGVSMHEVVFDIGGGIPRNRVLKAVQTGGPSGGCLPATSLGLHIDFDALAEAGSMMGSGGMIVMDEHTCPVEMARYFLSFCKDESCGKCTPCRDGIPALLEILERITRGEGRDGDLEMLEELGRTVKELSLCGLGQTAANPLLTTLRYFRDEYEAHIKQKRCPGGVCKALISSPCHHMCPVGMDPPAYIGFIAQGRFDNAYEVITNASPFPGICGRVCHYPCEFKCTSGDSGDPIAIRSLKRFVSDYARNKNGRPKKTPVKKYDEKVAVIGSGPAGLTCAYQLALQGYEVTAFEALPVPGGMLAVGIPEYRLPRDILEFEIDNVKRAGVKIETNTAVGKDVTLDELRGRGYKAFFVATGAHTGLKLGVEGEEAEGVMDAVAFLRDVNLGRGDTPGDRVGVVGGGNAAIDAARTALRMGTAEVHILYRRTRKEMPAQDEEIQAALDEGVKLHLLVAPKRVIAEDGRVTAVECLKMELGEVDRSGRRRPVPIEGSEFILELDALIPAISQEPDLTCLEGVETIEISKWKTIVADEETLQTTEPDVFAGGDVVTGPWTVTGAMGHGKRAAEIIHKYLRGEPLEPTYEPTRPTVEVPTYQMTEEELETITHRPHAPCHSASDRVRNFEEVELCLSDEQAIDEAKRCLRCDATSA